ncbi:putative monovalent cation/H+ antiporter subunit A [Jiella sp. M17.18]|uniref:putative monovalent cation/H+ antiporter subunit A n=1 Tax=Jiella sp. M17.18 TaxID=3234247 RepID=UPI0034DFA2D3
MTGLEPTAGFIALALPFIAAALAPMLTRLLGRHACWVLALAPAAAFVIVLGALPAVAGGKVFLFGFDWVPSFAVRFSFRLDGLSSTFALLVTGIGTLIVLYSGGYLAGHRDQGRFLSFILMFMGSMLGLVLADDLITLFVYWELTSITSFLLIGFDHHREAARRGAVQALVMTGGGGLALLAGLIAIRELTGLTSMSDVLAASDLIRNSAYYAPILILVLAGAFTKSAQMPFHIWLPNAMEAPTPVSAYLHSATMVKAGVYLLLRVQPALGGTELWTTILPAFGAVTLVLGALLSIRATDIKITLAYTTVSSLGLLVMLIGVGTQGAIEGAVLYLIAHSFFKGGLFMVAGSVDHGAGTRELGGLGGLRRAMPITFLAAVLCALSMGGVTPFVGFLSKETMYHALEDGGAFQTAVLVAAIAGNALMFAAAFIVALKPFLGKLPETIHHPHEGPLTIWLGPLVLGIAGLLGALFYGTYHHFLSSPMASAAIGKAVALEIGFVPHLNLAFALSCLTIAIGIGLYLASAGLRRTIAGTLAAIGWGPDKGFDQAMRGLIRLSFHATHFLQSGRLDYYMTATVAAIVAALLAPMIWLGALPAVPKMPDLRFYEWMVLGLILFGVIAVVVAKNRLTAIVSLGIQGFAVALIFMLLGAPDLSFTQFMVETLSVVILALVMTRLKLSPADHRPWREVLPDAALAAAGGAGFGLFLLSVVQRPFDPFLSDFFERYSYAIAHGHNIVNVIIVDFRGVDTMGEIAVVMTTGLAVLALIRIRVGRRTRALPDPSERTP